MLRLFCFKEGAHYLYAYGENKKKQVLNGYKSLEEETNPTFDCFY